MLGNGGVPIITGPAHVRGDALPAREDHDSACKSAVHEETIAGLCLPKRTCRRRTSPRSEPSQSPPLGGSERNPMGIFSAAAHV